MSYNGVIHVHRQSKFRLAPSPEKILTIYEHHSPSLRVFPAENTAG